MDIIWTQGLHHNGENWERMDESEVITLKAQNSILASIALIIADFITKI